MKLAIIGGGAMGTSLAEGLLKNGEPAENITISNPHLDKLKSLQTRGIKVTDSNKEAVKDCDLAVIAVKPWKVKEVIKDLLPHINKPTELTFIVAGVPGYELLDLTKESDIENISITMPNTAMVWAKSMTFIVSLKGDNLKSKNIFEKVGKVKEIEERLLGGATALASCGIAYALRYVRAATEGGVELGFKAAEAQDIVAQTMAGAVSLLETPGAHAETEIDKVTTPGGITIRGLNVMEREGFTNAVISGLKASKI